MKRELEDTLVQWMLTQSILCICLGKGKSKKGHQNHEMVVSNAVELMFRETAMSKSAGKGAEGHGDGNPKEKSKGSKSTKGSYKGRTSKTGLSGLEYPKSETSSETQESAQTFHTDIFNTDDSWFDDDWSCDEWNDYWSSVNWHEGWDASGSTLSLGSFDFGAMSSPKPFKWVRRNLDTGAAVNACPLNFGPDGAGDGRSIEPPVVNATLDGGAWHCQGYDEKWLLPVSERKTHGCTQSFVHCGRNCLQRTSRFFFGSDGFMMPVHCKVGQEMRIHFERWVSWYGRKQLIPVKIEIDIFKFFFLQ